MYRDQYMYMYMYINPQTPNLQAIAALRAAMQVLEGLESGGAEDAASGAKTNGAGRP